ncbi:hypothetical protein EJ357_15225 [Streptomyces cyaneochromogenes]|uniref:Uncharacterized protein n=1 Tax=Streptomyces cyaneochromogenes TaxID=2496836 RepID=A0A3Q9EMU5_9ACTN|nr:hypothetical protein [Streptomyces cyaneochromogenes]AZQ34663.1 hypothetical protein EJ357_15225 [Streptomyces cyaneochromogenes]
MTDADGGSVARMRVTNRGTDSLELILEPYGSDHWLRPRETFVVVAYGFGDADPFEVEHEPAVVTVHLGGHGHVTDVRGDGVACAHGRPETCEETPV